MNTLMQTLQYAITHGYDYHLIKENDNIIEKNNLYVPNISQLKNLADGEYNLTQIATLALEKKHTELDEIIQHAVSQKITDIHINQSGIYFRKNKSLQRQELDCNTISEILSAMLILTHKDSLLCKQEISTTITILDIKCRLSAFSMDSKLCFAIRILNTTAPSLQSINAPQILQNLAQSDNGLIIICGATGSGKSTTLAAMIDFINKTYSKHILTIEDPIEYEHKAQKSIITQRQIQRDSKSFESALISSLRQDPDVILIGEILESNVLRLALNHALSGHLVLTSFHANSCSHALSRMIGMLVDDPFAKQNISDCIRGIICQKLYVENGNLKVDFEILVATPAVKTLINENKINQINAQISMGREYGMQHFATH